MLLRGSGCRQRRLLPPSEFLPARVQFCFDTNGLPFIFVARALSIAEPWVCRRYGCATVSLAVLHQALVKCTRVQLRRFYVEGDDQGDIEPLHLAKNPVKAQLSTATQDGGHTGPDTPSPIFHDTIDLF